MSVIISFNLQRIGETCRSFMKVSTVLLDIKFLFMAIPFKNHVSSSHRIVQFKKAWLEYKRFFRVCAPLHYHLSFPVLCCSVWVRDKHASAEGAK